MLTDSTCLHFQGSLGDEPRKGDNNTILNNDKNPVNSEIINGSNFPSFADFLGSPDVVR